LTSFWHCQLICYKNHIIFGETDLNFIINIFDAVQNFLNDPGHSKSFQKFKNPSLGIKPACEKLPKISGFLNRKPASGAQGLDQIRWDQASRGPFGHMQLQFKVFFFYSKKLTRPKGQHCLEHPSPFLDGFWRCVSSDFLSVRSRSCGLSPLTSVPLCFKLKHMLV